MWGEFGWCFRKRMQYNKACFNCFKSLKGCLESFTTDPWLTSIASLLNSKSFGANDIKVVVKAASKIKDHFNNLLKANDFKQHCLGNYVTKFKLDKPYRK